MDRAIGQGGYIALPIVCIAMLAAWWVYVPIHELMHAWGCLLAGGEVSRLDIDEVYGAAWLATLFPYVVPGSDYAGQLSGFETGGSDVVYLVTVFFPYLLTLFPGVYLLRLAAGMRRGSAWILGASLPLALTPFLSLTGDYYEMGAILVSRLAATAYPDAVARWRGDDLMRIWAELPAGHAGWIDPTGLIASLVLGIVLALATYALAARIADRLIWP